jgi:hypothetical protein
MIVIIMSEYRIIGRRPNFSTSFIDTAVAIKFIEPVEMIPQYTLSSTKPRAENV